MRVPGLIPVPSGMQPPRSPVFSVSWGSEEGMGLQSKGWGYRAQNGVTEVGVGSSEAELCARKVEGMIGRCVDINKGEQTWS